jgi:paraquat-inducible protein B
MTEEGDPDNDKTDQGEVVERSGLRVSWAWLFPLFAAGAAVWLFWSNWKSKGPEIEILFDSAPGLQAGKTPLIYRGVEAGKVTGVKLDGSLSKVVVTVRLKAFASALARETTDFWIDRPEISLEQVSGLDSIIQGNSIRARIGGGPPATRFEGLSKPPLTPLEAPSLVLKLQARDIPFVARGAPLYYHGVAVGAVKAKALDADGLPYLYVVVGEEFASTVRSNARFWCVSATSVQAGSGGLKLNIAGLAALLQGGVEFDVFGTPGNMVKAGAEFELFADEREARLSGPPVRISFDDGQGLLAGQTQLRYLGLPVGLVEEARPDPSSGKVEVVARLEPGYDILRSAGSVFSLVRPRISLEGVSGLETLVSGVYIECVPGPAGERAEKFLGRTVTDTEWNDAQAENQGITVTLRAKEIPSIGKGALVFYRGIVVGKVKEKDVDKQNAPFLRVVIRKEFEQAVRRNARFWRLPATSVQAGPGILKVDVAGLDTLLQGGVEFDVFEKPGEAAVDGAQFELFANEHAARCSSPPIRISFENGHGLLAGQTQLRYLGVPVGLVEEIIPSNGKVQVVARLEPGYEILQREGTTFSLVRPRISLEGVSGLETLVSGVYIECVPGPKGKLVRNFVGRPFAGARWEGGLEVVVAASETGVRAGSPVYYRGVQVGTVERKTLSPDGRNVHLSVLIDQPYARLVRENTKFWDVSGFKASLGFLSIKLETETLESLARGGLAFATPDGYGMGPPAKRWHKFVLNKAPRPEWLRWMPSIPLANE